jgi:YD repeat-containing protein
VVSAYQSTTTKPETTTYAYDCNIGKVTGTTDANGVQTTYSYDSLNRPTYIKSAIGSSAENWTVISYPSMTQVNVKQDQQTAQDGVIQSSTTTDGLGRVIQTTAASGATSETTYDPLGRVYSVTTPHYGAATGTTYKYYDALGRIVQQTQPDNNKLFWCYESIQTYNQPNCNPQYGTTHVNGTWVDAMDEAEHDWQITSDPLGRKVKTMELGARLFPTSLETDYGYDGNDNLTSVAQQGAGEGVRNRGFVYDSLSRLLAANNPENASQVTPAQLSCQPNGPWTTCYSYYPNGNLQYRTDNRNVTTTYSYDALNRLISKSYSGEATSHPTPSSCYLYDSDSNSGSNTMGRLVAEWTQPGSCPSGTTSVSTSA